MQKRSFGFAPGTGETAVVNGSSEPKSKRSHGLNRL
jgi:hypothetical protein